MFGVTLGSRILTLDGEIPVEFLERNDRVITRRGARRLVSVAANDATSVFRCVQIDAYRLSLDQRQNVLLPWIQPVLVDLALAKVSDDRSGLRLLKASALISVDLAKGLEFRESRLFQLKFEAPELFVADGIYLASVPSPTFATDFP